jgi:gliding motility-associated-like protein
LQAVVTPLPVPDLPAGPTNIIYCLNQTSSSLTATPDAGNVLVWYDSPTAPTGSTTPPRPATDVAVTTTWWVSQKPLFGCESNRKAVTVTVTGVVPITFTIDVNRQCLIGNRFVFTNTTPSIGSASYSWAFGDGTTVQSRPGNSVTYSYTTPGALQASLTVSNAGACSGTLQLPVNIIPAPQAMIGVPDAACRNQVLSIADASLAPGATITQWWWSVNGVATNAASPALPTTITAAVPVLLVVTTAEGCRSDTARKNIVIHPLPVASFLHSNGCSNEPVILQDRSLMPAGSSGETITNWHWFVDGTEVSALQNPSVQLTGGSHIVALVAETNFGCKSPSADSSFQIIDKPEIDVAATDSCTGRLIAYNASVLSGNVSRWLWDFGAGPRNGAIREEQRYNQPGIHSIALIGESPQGCRDSLVRSFTIYKNEAYAGADTIAAWNQPLQLSAHVDPGQVFSWTPTTGLDDPAVFNPVSVWKEDLRYTLYARDLQGCESVTSILVKRYKGPDLYVADLFTPNNDGRNDLLHVLPVGVKTFLYFSVYDRNGSLLFRTTNASVGWDGRYKGIDLGTSTFVYVTEGIDYTGAHLLRKGTVTLVR